jgi:membrane protease YdiL (CAAX protease family)
MTLTVLIVVLLGPVVEEIVVRGVVLGALRQRLGRWAAIAVSAAMFAVLHASVWSMAPLMFLGLALGRLAVDRRSLWPAIGLHVLYNAAVIVPAFLIAGR